MAILTIICDELPGESLHITNCTIISVLLNKNKIEFLRKRKDLEKKKKKKEKKKELQHKISLVPGEDCHYLCLFFYER